MKRTYRENARDMKGGVEGKEGDMTRTSSKNDET